MTTQITYDRSKVTLAGGAVRVVSVAAQGPAGPANAPIDDQTVLGNVSGASAVPVALTASEAKALLAIASSDVSGLGALAMLDAVDTAQVVDGAITFAKMAALGAGVLIGSIAGGTPAALSAAQAKSLLAISTSDVSGLGLLALENTVAGALGYTPENAANRAQANGYASLGSDGKVPESQLPAIAITDTTVVASQAAMLALDAQKGDIAVRSDLSKSYVLSTNSPTTLADWIELRTPTDAVLSVAGKTGAVTLATGDIAGVATARLLGRSTAGAGGAEELTAAQAKTLLAIASTDVSGLGTAAVKNTGTAGNNVALLDGANTWSAAQTIAAGTLTASAPGLSVTQTWNNAAVNFTSALVNVTDTAKGGTSKLLDLQRNGVSQFYVRYDGYVLAPNNIVGTGLYAASDAGVLALGSSSDMVLARDAANVPAFRNGANAQSLRVYNTYTDVSNYERATLDWKTTSNWLRLATENAGTGSARNMALISAGGIVGIGGTTSSDPALKKSSTVLQARLADDSAFAPLQGKLRTDTNYTAGTFSATGYLTLFDAAGTAYRVPCAV